MTHKIFWQDPYLTELETRIAAVDGDQILLVDTIFFAFSGGQESDRGTIGGLPVQEAIKDGKQIRYRMPEGHGLKPGDLVKIEIDWARRYRLMRLHFAAEVILELVYQNLGQNLGSVEKIGAHIAEDKARIDFAWSEDISGQFPMLLEKARAIVAADHPIVSAFADRETEERYWEIPEFSRVPCGGTHLKRTGEIGSIELKRRNIGKGKERIEIYVG